MLNEGRPEKLKRYRLNETEFEKIKVLLGREPKDIEWPLFSALWSEHCSYKSSKIHLRKFAQTMTDKMLVGEGENAGVVDLGQGEQIVFKMESHNHPSFIEPYQGAATGVGGILRDIFTMGARPIALADFLCFGEIQAPRMRSLIDGVVRGIGGYGNAVGVPTVHGKTQLSSGYNQNILVNAMAVGLLGSQEKLALSVSKSPGAWVIYVGAATGKDGVHGAAMASESFDENSEAKKPNVQIGDPFFEKLLIESCLEVIGKDLVLSIQDMGAAGLTSSSFEMSAKSGLGFEIDLSQVPVRDATLTAEDILLSESQERMLLVCDPKKYAELKQIFERWGLLAVKIGHVREAPEVRLLFKGECLTEIDPRLLVDQAPQYQRKFQEWNFPNQVQNLEQRKSGSTQQKTFWSAEKNNWIYEQFDQRVGGQTLKGAEDSVAVLRLPESGRALAMAVGCRQTWMHRDSYIGAVDAVLEPTLKMAIKGFSPVGLTDCLNFANPEREAVMTDFVASVHGIRDIAIELGTPVVSGNVSFYNETLGQGIPPTPACGVMGLRTHLKNLASDQLKVAGATLLLVTWDWIEALDDLKWRGSTSLKGFGRKIDGLAQTVNELNPFSSFVIGDSGLESQLQKHAQNDIGYRLVPGLDLSATQLYQFVFEVDGAAEEKWSRELQKYGFKVENLGVSIQQQKPARRTFEILEG